MLDVQQKRPPRRPKKDVRGLFAVLAVLLCGSQPANDLVLLYCGAGHVITFCKLCAPLGCTPLYDAAPIRRTRQSNTVCYRDGTGI
jgi:hypothetical protein